MYLICSACHCDSNHTTKVGSRSIEFYPYPNDEMLKDQWQRICKSYCTSSVTKDLFRLCELHFEESSFTDDMKLKANAVPSIFVFRRTWKKNTKVYPPAKKRKPDDESTLFIFDPNAARKVYPRRRQKTQHDNINDKNKNLQPETKIDEEFHSSNRELSKIAEESDHCRNGCKLRDIIFSDDLAFMCENCGNIYIPQSINVTNIEQKVQPQVKKNLKCDVCYSKFKIQLEYENHIKLHKSMNSETSFLCHVCNMEFETIPILQKHILDVHVIGIRKEKQQDFKQTANLQCKMCNLSFKDEETLKNHITSHKENNNSALPLKKSKVYLRSL